MSSFQGKHAPLVVVIGGGMNRDGTSGQATKLRARRAVQLAKANPTWTFILSGDGRMDPATSSLTEADYMAQLFEKEGIAKSRYRLEHESRDTSGNAVLVAARYLQHETPRKLYVVTSPFHSVRALLMFQGVLGPRWTVEIIPSSPARGDAVRRANEPGGVDWTRRFFAGITPGDLPACIAKLLEVRPVYAFSKWLLPDDEPSPGDTTLGVAVA